MPEPAVIVVCIHVDSIVSFARLPRPTCISLSLGDQSAALTTPAFEKLACPDILDH
jgi:hypothetical protein